MGPLMVRAMKILAAPVHRAAPAPAYPASGWRSLLTHTHMMSGGLPDPENRTNLVDWMRQRHIDALGVGSPFTPTTQQSYQRFEDASRHLYYSKDFDPQSVKCPDEVAALIRDLNRISNGGPYLYLDNETPKARYGHLWFVGWWHDFPEWHDYDQPFDRWMCHEQGPDDYGPEPMPYERRPYMEIVSSQRQRGAMAFWAHPTSWWTAPHNGAFITNIASEMPAHLVAEGSVDGLVIMGYDAYRPSYLELWQSILDLGYEVLGVAETDLGLSSPNLWKIDPLFLTMFKQRSPALTTEGIVQALKAGQVYASSGPVLELEVDGVPMGSRLTSGEGQQHTVTLRAWSGQAGDGLGRLELLARNGEVVWSAEDPADGVYTLTVAGSAQPGYLMARVFGKGDLPGSKPDNKIKYFAVTNPVYLRPAGWKPIGPLTTEVRLAVAAGSPFAGTRVRFEDPVGNLLEEAALSAGQTVRAHLPANSRIRLKDQQGQAHQHYLINANPQVTELQRYLYRGRFLRDYPDMTAGNVPARAFRINEFREAMKVLELTV